ncbi:trigger factor [Salsuginibacillus halophilus]|uniref:Trigger factor n=1 Tax=Salsuginibacillus halophilus TaxID=517424 RepID=A0A2P8HCN9_9BACI|nr:trigger factor [Salsuginibacillus halophilus]PSL44005.1 trigger factor [Salsuginibacillus halophilus]
MTATWEKKEGNQGVLTINVDAEKLDEGLDQAFQKVRKQVNVPGFRKGKVPRKVFEQRFGVESLYQDAVDAILPQAYAAAVDEAGIEPVDQPDVDIKEIEQGQGVVFEATVTVKPEVQLGEYKGLEVEDMNTEINDEDVEEELKQQQEKHAELVVVEDGAVENGDTAVIDFKGFVDGEAFEGGEAENYSLEVGSEQFIPGFEEQLVGMRADEEKDVVVTFPEEYHAEELAGKEATFQTKLHEVKRKELPALDDEFAKDASDEVETLDELRAQIKERLENEKAQEKENHIKDTLVEKASDNAEIDIPDAMLVTEADRMLQEFGQRLQSQGMSLDMYYQFAGTDEDGMKEQFKPEAEKRVQMNLVLEAIAEAENVEVSEEDIENELDKMAEMYQRDKEEIRSLVQMQGGNDMLKNDLRVQKAIDVLVENSKLVEQQEEQTAEQ